MKIKTLVLSSLLSASVCISSIAAPVLEYSLTDEYDREKKQIISVFKLYADYGEEYAFAKTSLAVSEDSESGADKLKALRQVRLDKNGVLNTELPVAAETGEYSLTVKTELGDKPLKEKITLTDYTDDSVLISGLDAYSFTPESLRAYLDDKSLELIIDREIYYNLSDENRLDLAEDFVNSLSSYTIREYTEDFLKLSFKYGMSSKNKPIIKHIVENYPEKTVIPSSALYDDYLKLTDKDFVYENMAEGEYTTDAELIESFENGVAVSALRNIETKSQVTSLLDKYSDYYGADTGSSDYKKYESYITGYVYTNRNIPEEPHKVSELVLEGIKEAKKIYSGNQASGGGGGGGGGSSSSVKKSENKVSPDYVAEAEKDVFFDKTSVFTDVTEEHWAYMAVSELAYEKIIAGREKGIFAPDESITRAEFVKMISGAWGYETENPEKVFSDVSESDWFYPYVSAAYKNKIITGNGEGFAPEKSITRQDAFLILARALGLSAKDGDTEFTDDGEISDYAKGMVKAAVSSKIANGFSDGTVKPLKNITRAEAAQLIYNAISKGGLRK